MGGSAGTFNRNRPPEKLREMVREAEAKTADVAFQGQLAETLGDLLSRFNGRDVATVRERLDSLKEALSGEIDGSFDQLFGGSVAKRTYVDGLSDIDSLLVINDTDLRDQSPQATLNKLEKILHDAFGTRLAISRGRMAVTIEYADGMTIQLLPALKMEGAHLKVPSSRTDGWSKIDPVAFQNALSTRNDECRGKLIPTLKLAKAINGQLPPGQGLSGYHMESIGIAAFKGYSGELSTRAMLPYFFERAKELVLSPIKDRSGQSIHVDEYLGDARSEQRQIIGHVLSRIARRMQNATAANSVPQWRAIFGLDQ
jgi:hypothetical protein